MERVITSITNNKIKNLVKLKNNKFDCYLSFSLSSIKKAYSLNLLKEVYSLNKVDFKGFDNCYIANEDVLNKVNKGSEIVGVIKKNISDIVNIKNDKVIYLDEISDPINLAKIILLMRKYGYKDLILSKRCVSIYNEKCLEYLNYDFFDINIYLGDITTLKFLKEKGYNLLSTGLKSSIYLKDIKKYKKFIVIFGNEARGVNEEILSISDVVIKIPISNIDSLNVSVAASIILDNLD